MLIRGYNYLESINLPIHKTDIEILNNNDEIDKVLLKNILKRNLKTGNITIFSDEQFINNYDVIRKTFNSDIKEDKQNVFKHFKTVNDYETEKIKTKEEFININKRNLEIYKKEKESMFSEHQENIKMNKEIIENLNILDDVFKLNYELMNKLKDTEILTNRYKNSKDFKLVARTKIESLINNTPEKNF